MSDISSHSTNVPPSQVVDAVPVKERRVIWLKRHKIFVILFLSVLLLCGLLTLIWIALPSPHVQSNASLGDVFLKAITHSEDRMQRSLIYGIALISLFSLCC